MNAKQLERYIQDARGRLARKFSPPEASTDDTVAIFKFEIDTFAVLRSDACKAINTQLVESSGNADFDRAAEQALHKTNFRLISNKCSFTVYFEGRDVTLVATAAPV